MRVWFDPVISVAETNCEWCCNDMMKSFYCFNHIDSGDIMIVRRTMNDNAVDTDRLLAFWIDWKEWCSFCIVWCSEDFHVFRSQETYFVGTVGCSIRNVENDTTHFYGLAMAIWWGRFYRSFCQSWEKQEMQLLFWIKLPIPFSMGVVSESFFWFLTLCRNTHIVTNQNKLSENLPHIKRNWEFHSKQ